MKIATWNLMVTEDWSKLNSQIFIEKQIDRQRQAWNFLKNKLKPDIVFLQEVLLKSIDESELGINIFWTESHTSMKYSKNDTSKWGTAIFVNKKYCDFTKDITLEVFPNEDSKYTGKVKVVQVNFDNDQILFSSLHLDTGESGLEQIKSFFNEKFVSQKNLVIGGDLNCDKYYINGTFDKKFFNETIGFSNLIECEPLYKQTFFRGNLNDDNDVEAIQDDYIFVSKELYEFVETQHIDEVKQYKGKNFNYGKIKTLSDHSILYISLDVKE